MKTIKITAFLLIGCLLLPACSANTPNAEENKSEQYAADIPEETAAAIAIDRPDIPDGTDYGGYEFRILAKHFLSVSAPHTLTENEVFACEETGEPLNDAVYKRNTTVEELLNVKITEIPGQDIDVVKYAKNAVLAGDDAFDALCIQDYDNISLLQAGCLVNLYNVPNLDLSRSWWDRKAVGELSYMRSKLYFVCGDINWYDDYAIMVLFFNKRLFQENGFEFPYDKVIQGKWTLDEFSKLIKDFTKDLNGDGVLDHNDQWGMLENTDSVYHFIVGGGESISSLDENGLPKLNALTERHISVVNGFGDIFSDKNIVLQAGNGQMKGVSNEWSDGIFKVFREGRGLMLAEVVGSIPTFRDMEDDFGLLPQPKFNEEQEYASFTSGGWASSYSIPTAGENFARTGTILEAMAGYSADTLKPALFDVSLKSKFSRDEESEKMFDIIFASKVFDWGERFKIGNLYGAYQGVATKGFGGFVSSIEKVMPQAERALEKLIDLFEELEN